MGIVVLWSMTLAEIVISKKVMVGLVLLKSAVPSMFPSQYFTLNSSKH